MIENSEYLRCEVAMAARREMIVKLDDFLRRRSKIALVVHRDRLRESAGLTEACQVLFGAAARERGLAPMPFISSPRFGFGISETEGSDNAESRFRSLTRALDFGLRSS